MCVSSGEHGWYIDENQLESFHFKINNIGNSCKETDKKKEELACKIKLREIAFWLSQQGHD